MTSLDLRSVSWLVMPFVLACTKDTVPNDTDTDGSGTTAVDSSSGGGPTTSAPSTGTSDAGSSSEGGTTTAADTGSSGGGSATGESGETTEGGCIAVCGNNVIECDEVCDLAQLAGETCVSLGNQGGQLGCSLTCDAYNELGCFICGNGVVDLAEDCESVVPEGITCESMGFEGGELQCAADCLWDTSDCSICGDGTRQGTEDCDGVDLGGQDCMAIGFDGGDLGCQVSCAYDYSGCMGGQYIQDFEAGPPLPLELATGGAADWVVDMANPINGSFSAWSTDLSDGQNNFMTISATFAVAGDVSFWHEESTEGSFDFLEFYIDGVLIDSWSGLNPAALATYPVAAGVHDFEWRYDKDGSVSTGSDSVWVDDITMIPGVPI